MRDRFTSELFNWNIDIEAEIALIINGHELSEIEIAQLFGIMDGAIVRIYTHAGYIFINIKHAYYHAIRSIPIDDDEFVIYNNLLKINEDKQDLGLATRMLGYEVLNARKYGFKYIRTHGGRDESSVGYCVWPKLGFNGKLPYEFLGFLPENLKFVKDVIELIDSDEGYKLWEEFGTGIELWFELELESFSSQVLDNYLTSKGIIL